MNNNPLFTVSETAKYLKVSTATVYKMIKNKDLRAIKIGKRGIRISKSDLEGCVKNADKFPCYMS